MGSENSLTLQNSITWASLLTQRRPLTLIGNEPALTCANMIIASILAPPFKWAWNRSAVVFQTVDPGTPGNGGFPWLPTTPLAAGYRLIDTNGNQQVVTTAGATDVNVPFWNPTIGLSTTDGTVIWTTQYVSDYQVAVSNFGYIEKATLTETSVLGTVQGKVWDIPNKTLNLTTDSDTGRWQGLAPYLDDNNGNITFRPSPGRPDKQYNCTVTYQERASLLVNLTDNWPIPDMFSQIYNTGFLGMIWLFADDPRSAFMLQRFAAMVIAVSDGLTDQEKNSFLDQWDVMSASRRAASRTNQGTGARGAS